MEGNDRSCEIKLKPQTGRVLKMEAGPKLGPCGRIQKSWIRAMLLYSSLHNHHFTCEFFMGPYLWHTKKTNPNTHCYYRSLHISSLAKASKIFHKVKETEYHLFRPPLNFKLHVERDTSSC